ncbi:MAG: DUF1345 domain-containing protein [Verrucomicrobiota bacterium]
MNPLMERIKHWDAHHRFLTALAVSAAVTLLTAGHLRLPVQLVAAWNAFSGCLLALTWFQIVTAQPAKFLSTARLQDSSRTAISLFVIAAACISLFAVTFLLGTAKELPKEALLKHVLLAVVTVVGSWSLIHTVFALRYAHIFYGDSKNRKQDGHARGLEFPGEPSPDYLDFAYFSFVIGMTCQVSDVQIANRSIRRLALVHGLLSFGFNTVILALSINIVSGML